MNKELLDKINAAVEADQIAFKQAAANLNLTLNEGAISGRRQGYFKGYSDAIGEIERLKGENSKMRKALENLIADIKRKPNDTRYATAIGIATEALKTTP